MKIEEVSGIPTETGETAGEVTGIIVARAVEKRGVHSGRKCMIPMGKEDRKPPAPPLEISSDSFQIRMAPIFHFQKEIGTGFKTSYPNCSNQTKTDLMASVIERKPI